MHSLISRFQLLTSTRVLVLLVSKKINRHHTPYWTLYWCHVETFICWTSMFSVKETRNFILSCIMPSFICDLFIILPNLTITVISKDYLWLKRDIVLLRTVLPKTYCKFSLYCPHLSSTLISILMLMVSIIIRDASVIAQSSQIKKIVLLFPIGSEISRSQYRNREFLGNLLTYSPWEYVGDIGCFMVLGLVVKTLLWLLVLYA